MSLTVPDHAVLLTLSPVRRSPFALRVMQTGSTVRIIRKGARRWRISSLGILTNAVDVAIIAALAIPLQ